MIFSGMTDPSGTFGPKRLPAIPQSGQAKHFGLVKILDRIESAIHVAVESCIANRHFRLVSGGHHHQIELVGNRHQDRAARTCLQIFFSDIPWQSGENWLERGFEPFDRRRYRQIS